MKVFKIIIALSILFIQGCTMIKITASKQRSDHPRSFEIQNGITVTTWGEINVNKVDFFPSGFQIKFNRKVAYIDPVEISTDEKADYIFITHSHPDHLSIRDIQRVLKPETRLVCPRSVEKKLRKLDCEIFITKPGQNRDFSDIQYSAVPAYNTKPVFLWLKAHPKSKENVGYILRTAGGISLYHAGDTDNVTELKEIKDDIDVAFLPIGGDNLTMNIEDAAKLANAINPKTVVPMHFEVKRSNELDQFKKLLDKNSEMRIMSSMEKH